MKKMGYDKEYKLRGFAKGETFVFENRTLWNEIVIRRIDCHYCESQDSITFHIKDVPKLFKILKKLLKEQKILTEMWEKA